MTADSLHAADNTDNTDSRSRGEPENALFDLLIARFSVVFVTAN
jgi:hypothetical protein